MTRTLLIILGVGAVSTLVPKKKAFKSSKGPKKSIVKKPFDWSKENQDALSNSHSAGSMDPEVSKEAYNNL